MMNSNFQFFDSIPSMHVCEGPMTSSDSFDDISFGNSDELFASPPIVFPSRPLSHKRSHSECVFDCEPQSFGSNGYCGFLGADSYAAAPMNLYEQTPYMGMAECVPPPAKIARLEGSSVEATLPPRPDAETHTVLRISSAGYELLVPRFPSPEEPDHGWDIFHDQQVASARTIANSSKSYLNVLRKLNHVEKQQSQVNVDVESTMTPNSSFSQQPISSCTSSSPESPTSSSPVVLPSPCSSASSPPSTIRPSSPTTIPSSPPQAHSLCLNICSPVEQLWYAERPFPAFHIEILESTTRQRMTEISGWKIGVSMIDGFGADASDKLSGNGQSPAHCFPVINGKATVSGIRFRAVSSKAGGGFRLVISLVFPDSTPCALISTMTENIQVLSYRLYHAPKVAFENLRPDDSVSKMKGIGSMYAKRFQSLGIERVSQLANISVSTLGEEGIKKLLENLRKDRGAMTLAKLNEYVQQARDIVSRCPTFMQANNQTHTVARISNTCFDTQGILSKRPGSVCPSGIQALHPSRPLMSLQSVPAFYLDSMSRDNGFCVPSLVPIVPIENRLT